jgi:60 kDa SS-A/Ro ribonucleoprotein
MSEAAARITGMLADGERLRAARVHPVAVLSALTTYQSGCGVRGHGQWEPVGEVVDALNTAFYQAFGNVTPAGRRIVLALDVSSSMAMGRIAGVPGLTPRVGSAAMALVTAATEPQHTIVAFTTGTYRTLYGGSGISRLAITPAQRLDDVVQAVSSLPFGGTDCALPMLWALENGVAADAFVIYTDSETWAGDIHPSQALQQYRARTGIPARLVVVGMVASDFSIADPNDGGMLDVVGFDTAAPELISSFVRGEI